MKKWEGRDPDLSVLGLSPSRSFHNRIHTHTHTHTYTHYLSLSFSLFLVFLSFLVCVQIFLRIVKKVHLCISFSDSSPCLSFFFLTYTQTHTHFFPYVDSRFGRLGLPPLRINHNTQVYSDKKNTFFFENYLRDERKMLSHKFFRHE